MSTLHCYGDSFTEGQPDKQLFEPFQRWREYRGGNLPLSWSELLSQKLNMKLRNLGIGGHSNPQTFDDVSKDAHLFQAGDIVIVNWTYRDRFRWGHIAEFSDGTPVYRDENGNPKHTWKKLSANNANPEDFKYISQSTKDDFVYNRSTFNCYTNEIYNQENLLEQYANSKGFHIFFWSTDDNIIINLPEERRKIKRYMLQDTFEPGSYNIPSNGGDYIRYIISKGGRTIYNETEQTVNDDTHLGETGHRVQYELFYEYISKYIF